MTKTSSERHHPSSATAAKPTPTEPKKHYANRFSALSDTKGNGEGREKKGSIDGPVDCKKGGSTTSWADICADGGVMDDGDKEEYNLFPLLHGEAPFLVGVKGRNISLIRKFSGMAIYIKGDQVSMVQQRPNANHEMAWRMILSACYGGILRWFDNPNATKKGYPDEHVSFLESIAATCDLSIDLLRSKRGHMCLMLIPQLTVKSIKDRPSDEQILYFKTKLQEARVLLLEALSDLNPIPTLE